MAEYKWINDPLVTKNDKVRRIRESVNGFITDNSPEIELMYSWKCRIGFIFWPSVLWNVLFYIAHLVLPRGLDYWALIAIATSIASVFFLFGYREFYAKKEKERLKKCYYYRNPQHFAFLQEGGFEP